MVIVRYRGTIGKERDGSGACSGRAAWRGPAINSLMWASILLFGLWWAWRRQRQTYFFYDEWEMVSRVTRLAPWRGMNEPYNQHWWFFQDPIYRVQVRWFGLGNHTFVVAASLASLLALHSTVTLVLRRLGVALVSALVLGLTFTYLGAASQNFVFPIQASPMWATALGYFPAVVVLGHRPTLQRAAVAGGAAVLAILADSAYGAAGFGFTSVLIVLSWPWRWTLALVPALAALAWWYGFVDLGSAGPAGSVGDRARFALEMLVRAAGADLGRGPHVGIAALAVLGALVAWLAVVERPKLAEHPTFALSYAAGVALVVVIAGTARARGGLAMGDWTDYNRYLQSAGLPLMLAAAPIVAFVAASIARRAPAVGSWRGVALTAVAATSVFAAGAGAESRYADRFLAWNDEVVSRLPAATATVAHGCPAGTEFRHDAELLGAVSPQLRAGLVRSLLDRGLLVPRAGVEPDAAMTATMCI